MRKTGFYEHLGNSQHFIPFSLPPYDPSLILNQELINLQSEVMFHLGKLNGMSSNLPNIQRFIKAYVIKEALLTSAIEGVHTTFLNVFTQPLEEATPDKDTQLVINYTKALDVALSMIQKEGMPLVARVLCAAHAALMSNGEGEKANPGHYRKQNVKVGNLIPPPSPKIAELMKELEQFINTDETFSPLIKAGLAHVQFETIHPFLDGNGRIGRLLILLVLIENNIITEPLIYPSYYFKKNAFEYYQKLDGVRMRGDFEGWILFYLQAMKESCIDAYERAKKIEALHQSLTNQIVQDVKSIKSQETRLRTLEILFNYPVISINELSNQLDVSYNTANQIITYFVEIGIISEITQQKRKRLFKFQQYLDLLEYD